MIVGSKGKKKEKKPVLEVGDEVGFIHDWSAGKGEVKEIKNLGNGFRKTYLCRFPAKKIMAWYGEECLYCSRVHGPSRGPRLCLD